MDICRVIVYGLSAQYQSACPKGNAMLASVRYPCVMRLGITLITLVFSGCAGLGWKIKSPQVNLVDLRIIQVRPLETTLEVDMRVINPNDRALTLRGVESNIQLNGKTIGTGLSNQTAVIPAFGTDIISLTLYASVINMAKSVLNLTHHDPLTYRIKGSMRVSNGTVGAAVPFVSEGELSLTPPVR
jgi:LEA14-like dessication related protein